MAELLNVNPQRLNPQRFVNDVVKAWDELNALLSQRYAFQPDVSDVTRLAGALAVAVKHQADLAGHTDRSAIDAASLDNKPSSMCRSVNMTSSTRPVRRSGIG